MRITASNADNGSRIKAVIKKLYGDTVECEHLTSHYKIKAFYKHDMDIVEGQVVLLEFRETHSGSGYIVIDDLMEELDATVLEAQHLIADGMMYTSIIMESVEKKKRMHSLVPSNNKLIAETSIIMKGDMVRIRINNGVLFGIKY